MELKGGHITHDSRLGRIYEQDLRSLNYLVRGQIAKKPRPRNQTWVCPQWLDQGREGACVGFGFAHDLAAEPVSVLGITDQFAREAIYWQAQREDPWEGGAYPDARPFYEGTSVLAGAKVVTDLGFYSGYTWGLSANEIAAGIGHVGPAVLGLNWYEGMYDTDENGWIHPTGDIVGGHCIAAIGVVIRWRTWISGFLYRSWDNVDPKRSFVILHNSWGPLWGISGRAKISLEDLQTLMDQQGEACFPVRTDKTSI